MVCDMKKVENVVYGDDKCHLLDIYLPDTTEFPVFVYFHGGGLEGGDKADGEVFCKYRGMILYESI